METIMSTMTRAPAAAAHLPARPLSWRMRAAFARWWAAHMERRLARLAARRLHAMSDRELEDIGLTRGEIDFAVRGERDRMRILLPS
jgi:uncharacterized protein YjiS (DUF1127 family)